MPQAYPLDHWTLLSTTTTISALAHGNDRYLAAGSDGIFLTSTNGTEWQPIPIHAPDPVAFEEMVYADGKWVLVGPRGSIMTSEDGSAWTRRWSGTDSHLRGLTYGNGQFVAVGSLADRRGRAILTSSNAVEWIVRDLTPDEGALWDVEFGAGLFVTVGNSGALATSTDGRHWTTRTNITGDRLSGLVFGNGQFLAVGSGGIFSSTNGTAWKTNATTSPLFDVAFGNGRFVATGDETRVWTSTDGVQWTKVQSGAPWPLSVVKHAGGRFIIAGQHGTLGVSTNGLDWAIHTATGTPLFNQIALGKGRMAAVGDGSIRVGERSYAMTRPLVMSADGQSWQNAFDPRLYGFVHVSFAGEQFFAFGRENASPTQLVLATSPGAAAWTAQRISLQGMPMRVAFGHGLYVGAGDGFSASTTGTDWRTVVGTGATGLLKGLTFGNGRFVAVGPEARAYSSSDGTNWVSRIVPHGWEDVAFGNGTFVAVGRSPSGETNFAYTSPDGLNWAPRNIPQGHLTSIAFGGGWFAALSGNVLFSSPDGISWRTHQMPTSASFASIGYDNGRFVAVGNNGLVMESRVLPALAIHSSASDARLQIAAPPGVFAIESSPTLHPGSWTELQRITNSPAHGIPLAPSAETQRFYRATEVR